MKKIKIKIANKTYTVELAETEEQHETGLQGRTELQDNAGMLFVFDGNDTRGFWMKDTEIPLDIIFIDDDLIVKEVYEGKPNNLSMLEGECTYVLEVNPNSGIKVGDELDFEPDNKQLKKSDKMLVLD